MTHWLWLGVVGCSLGDREYAMEVPGADYTSREVALTIEVLPTVLRESYDVDAPYRALPQSFPQAPVVADGGAVDVGRLQLATPVYVEGSVSGFEVNPLVAELPGEQVPVAALVQLQRPGTIQSYVVATGEDDGRFGVWAVPGAGYRLQVVPADPLLPFLSGVFDVLDPPPDAEIDLGAGSPIYGRVTEQGVPLVGARVHAVDEFGLSGAVAVTDALGVYVLRVSPGSWTVVCDGRDNGRDPTLTFPVDDVDDAGRMLDIDYPPIANAQIGGGVDESDGGPARDATVRLIAESLDGFDGLDVSWSTEVRVNSDGFFYSAVLPGEYTVEVLPAEGRGKAHTPLRLEGVRAVDPYTEVPTVQLEPLVRVTGEVTLAGQGTGVGSAHVLCTEIGFGARSFEVFTNPGGAFGFDVANVPLSCETSPPSDQTTLASTRFSVDPSGIEGSIPVELTMGEIVSGEVRLDGEPEPFAVVEVRDAAHRLLGSGLTTESGSFSIRVDLSSAL